MRNLNFKSCIVFGNAVLLMFFTNVTASAVVIDAFDVDDTPDYRLIQLTEASSSQADFYLDPNLVPKVLGVERDMILTPAGVTDPMARGTLETYVTATMPVAATSGIWSVSTDPGIKTKAQLQYDGEDMSAALNKVGLGQVNLAANGENNFRMKVISYDGDPGLLSINVWGGETTASQVTLDLLNDDRVKILNLGENPYGVNIPFLEFTLTDDLIAMGASSPLTDFTKVTAIEVLLEGAAVDVAFSSFETVSVVVPEPSTSVSLLIGFLALIGLGTCRARGQRRRLR